MYLQQKLGLITFVIDQNTLKNPKTVKGVVIMLKIAFGANERLKALDVTSSTYVHCSSY